MSGYHREGYSFSFVLKMRFYPKHFRCLAEGLNNYCKNVVSEYSFRSRHENLLLGARKKSTVVPGQEYKTNKVIYGQPSPETHPHILSPGELVPGFTSKQFAERRSRLIKSILSSNPKGCHVVIIPSASVKYMTEKIPYIFRQNSDFRYLTGCLEPDSALVIIITSDNSTETTLFVREKTSHSELWEGPRTGVEFAPQFFGVERAESISNLKSELSVIRKTIGKFTLWYDFLTPANELVHTSVAKFLSESGMKELFSVKSKVQELRLIKSKSEQAVLKESANIASRAIEKAMSASRPGITEHQLFATVDYYCRMNKAEHLAYPPVVAAGNNANIIHYIENTQVVKDGEMILMDAGCELHGYCSDITRTWPVNGKFTEPQRTLYDIVLKTQLDLINLCKERPITLNQIFDEMCIMLGKNLKEGHVLTKQTENMKPDTVGFKLCPHHVGHYLGMDVHDTGTLNRNIPLQDGMLITIEPGLYVRYGCDLAKPEFHGMGIRIEDDVLVSESDIEVISNAFKYPDDIEHLCQSSSS